MVSKDIRVIVCAMQSVKPRGPVSLRQWEDSVAALARALASRLPYFDREAFKTACRVDRPRAVPLKPE
jgi:hypothetical protein